MEMIENSIFNMKKLPEYFNDFIDKKVAIIGVGAVGSYLAESLVKMKVFHLTLIDFDPFEKENSAKSSCAYKPMEDSGKNKARALAENLNEHFEIDSVHGIDASITCFGPMAFTEYDIVALALDNFAAKIYYNQIWLQIPKEKRPLLIFGGTFGETAEINCIDGTDTCVRCNYNEKSLANPFKRNSCAGINYRTTGDIGEHAITSGLASAYSAFIMAEQCRGYFLGHKGMLNIKTEYTAYPNLGLRNMKPIRRSTCPDCKNYHSVEDAEELTNMDVLNTTVGELLEVIESKYPEGKVDIIVPFIKFGNIVYSKIIKDDYCRCCGKKLTDMYEHEFRTKYEDLLCEKCKASKSMVSTETKNEKHGTTIDAITSCDCPESLKNKTLYEIGFAIGSFIKVTHFKKKEDCIIDDGVRFHTFYCGNDAKLMDLISKLEG